MTGIARPAITNEFDARRVFAHLNGIARLADSAFAAPRREIGEFMLGNVQDNFDTQRLFDGSAMPQSKAAQGRTTTWKANNRSKGRVKGAVRDAGKTLIAKHHLYDSYVYQLTARGVEIGSALIYAAIHHFGGMTGRLKARFKMTARPVLGVGEKQERAIGDYLIKAIEASQ
ncbi:MAG: phage virion morphogenesis protein [Pseudomonadota bacterium]